MTPESVKITIERGGKSYVFYCMAFTFECSVAKPYVGSISELDRGYGQDFRITGKVAVIEPSPEFGEAWQDMRPLEF